MGLFIGLKVSPLNRAWRLWLTCAAQKSFISTADMCFHLPQYLIITHKEAIFYTVSFMQGENKCILLVVTCCVSLPLWMRKLKLLRSVLGFPELIYCLSLSKKWRKLNSLEKVILMLSLITIPTLAVAVTAVFLVLEGGVAASGYRFSLSNADHILFHRMRKNISQQFLEAKGFPIWGKQGNFTGHFNLTAHLDY